MGNANDEKVAAKPDGDEKPTTFHESKQNKDRA
jgi:hypothetical protein